jgi:predicted metal-dependent peptidase
MSNVNLVGKPMTYQANMTRIITNNAADLRISQAITSLIQTQPFFATIAIQLLRKEDPSCDTMWTDGKSLGYNPDFVTKLQFAELVGVLAHEVLHVALLHPFRQEFRKIKPWNIACDKTINHIVKEAGMHLPNGVLPGVPDRSAEELYNPEDEDGEEGSGNAMPGETRAPEHEDGSALSEAELEERKNETRITVQQAANVAKKAGKLPGSLARELEDILTPKAPWKEILARFVDSFNRTNYNWSRPNRRYLSTGFILPSLHAPDLADVIIAPDTSGSIDQAMLAEICTEAMEAMEVYNETGNERELTIAWWDTRVYPQTITDPDELAPLGGGGTDFSAVTEWFLAVNDDHHKGIIAVTDGYVFNFGSDPGVPVLWILTHTNHKFNPPFGEVTCVLNH